MSYFELLGLTAVKPHDEPEIDKRNKGQGSWKKALGLDLATQNSSCQDLFLRLI
jgi:hypothetical protein